MGDSRDVDVESSGSENQETQGQSDEKDRHSKPTHAPGSRAAGCYDGGFRTVSVSLALGSRRFPPAREPGTRLALEVLTLDFSEALAHDVPVAAGQVASQPAGVWWRYLDIRLTVAGVEVRVRLTLITSQVSEVLISCWLISCEWSGG